MSTSSHDPFWDPEDSADDEHAFEMQAAIVKIAQTQATSLTMSKSFRSSCSYSKCRSKDEQTDHEDIGGNSDLRNSWAQTRESPTGSTPGSDTNSTTRQSRLGYEPARQDRKSKIYDLESLVRRANISCSYSKCRSKDEQTDHEDIGGNSDLRNSWAQTRESPTGSTPGSDTNSTTRQSRLGYEPARQDRKSKIYDLESLVHRANINRSSYRIHRQQVASSIVDSWQRENAHCPESSKKGATMTRQKQAGRPHAAVAVAY